MKAPGRDFGRQRNHPLRDQVSRRNAPIIAEHGRICSKEVPKARRYLDGN